MSLAPGEESEEGDDPSPDDLLVFTASDHHYAAEARSIEEVLPLGRITPLPGAGPAVRGLLNHRGELMLALDSAELLGEAPRHPGPAARVLVLRRGRQATGLLVGAVVGILRLAPERFETEPAAVRPRFSVGAAHHDGAIIHRLDLPAFLAELDSRLTRRA